MPIRARRRLSRLGLRGLADRYRRLSPAVHHRSSGSVGAGGCSSGLDRGQAARRSGLPKALMWISCPLRRPRCRSFPGFMKRHLLGMREIRPNWPILPTYRRRVTEPSKVSTRKRAQPLPESRELVPREEAELDLSSGMATSKAEETSGSAAPRIAARIRGRREHGDGLGTKIGASAADGGGRPQVCRIHHLTQPCFLELLADLKAILAG